MNFDVRGGVSLEEVRLLTERFIVELDNYKVVKLINMEKRDSILKEQNISLTCSSMECAIEAGKNLAAQYVIYGSIGKLGSLYTLNIYLSNVESNSIETSCSLDFNGPIEDLLMKGMREAANKMLTVRNSES
jgi:hypothetical protein